MLLTTRAGKLVELLYDPRVLGQADVARELEHPLGGVAVERLLVVQDVPDAGGAVLRVPRPRGVDEPLLRRRVRAEEGGQAVRLDGLVAKERDEAVGVGERAGEQAVGRRGGAVPPAHEGPDPRAQGADHRGGRARHLDEVGHAGAVPGVLVEPVLHLVNDLLQPAVRRARHLLGREHDAPVGAAARPGPLGEPGRVVEAYAHRLPRQVRAPARRAPELGRHVGGYVVPDAARVCGTLGRVAGGDVGVSLAGLPVLAVVGDDIFHGAADRCELWVGEVEEVADELFGVEFGVVVLPGPDFWEDLVHARVGLGERGCASTGAEKGAEFHDVVLKRAVIIKECGEVARKQTNVMPVGNEWL